MVHSARLQNLWGKEYPLGRGLVGMLLDLSPLTGAVGSHFGKRESRPSPLLPPTPAPKLSNSWLTAECAPPTHQAAGSSLGLTHSSHLFLYTTFFFFLVPFSLFHTSVDRLVGFQDSWERCQPPSVRLLFNSGTWELSLSLRLRWGSRTERDVHILSRSWFQQQWNTTAGPNCFVPGLLLGKAKLHRNPGK